MNKLRNKPLKPSSGTLVSKKKESALQVNVEALEKEINEVVGYIETRAEENELPKKMYHYLYDIDTPLNWDCQDLQNHNYDLGYLNGLKSALKIISNGRNKSDK